MLSILLVLVYLCELQLPVCYCVVSYLVITCGGSKYPNHGSTSNGVSRGGWVRTTLVANLEQINFTHFVYRGGAVYRYCSRPKLSQKSEEETESEEEEEEEEEELDMASQLSVPCMGASD